MQTRRWFFALSVLLLAALLCVLGPAALAEGPDSEIAFRADLARLGAHTDEIAAMREDALISYLNCLFDAEAADDPIAQECLLNEAQLCWTLYNDLLSVQNKAELAAQTQPEADPYYTEAEPDPFQAPQEPDRETADEFRLDEYPAPEADFGPDETPMPDWDEYNWNEYDWGFAGYPFFGGHGPWQHEWMPGWETWDDDFDYDGPWAFFYEDPWAYYSDDPAAAPDEEPFVPAEEPAPAEQADDTEPVESVEPAEIYEAAEPVEPDTDALPAGTPDASDEYEDWAQFEELLMQALMEALFGDQAQEPISMENPWIDAADPDEAASASGLRMDAPEALPKEMELQGYRAMDGTVEAVYSDGYDELTLRASLDQNGLALTGDYNTYTARWQEKVGDLVIDCLGDGEKINAAAWSIDGISYALDMAPGKEGLGLSYDEISAITASVEAIPVQIGEKTEPSAEPAAPSEEPLEMPFAPETVENLTSEAVEEAPEEQPVSARPARFIIGGGETYIYFD